MSVEIAGKILDLMYEIWFKNYVIGFSVQDLIGKTGYKENQINQAMQSLESNGLIVNNNPSRYVITTFGVDKLEEMLSPAILAAKKHERRRILEALAELYRNNIYDRIDNTTLAEKIQFTDSNYLLGTVVYLEQIGLVNLDMLVGGFFYIRLTANGFQSLQEHLTDNSVVMANAYRLLFYLENYMRKFIETKLTARYGTKWWDKGISKSMR